MKRKAPQKKKLVSKLLVVGAIIGVLILVPYSLDGAKKVREAQSLEQVRPAFEAELVNIIPSHLRVEEAPYGQSYSAYGPKGTLTNVNLTKTFRIRNLSKDEISSSIKDQLRLNKYTFDSQSGLRAYSSNKFTVNVLVIPFEEQGYIDITVTLDRPI